MNYLINLDFQNNYYIQSRFNRKDLTALDVSMQLSKNHKIHHFSNRCMTKLFSINDYNLFIQGKFEFENSCGKKFSIDQIIKLLNINDIYRIFLNFNNDTDYELTDQAQFFIKSNDMTKIKKIDLIKENPLSTMSEHFKDISILKNVLLF